MPGDGFECQAKMQIILTETTVRMKTQRNTLPVLNSHLRMVLFHYDYSRLFSIIIHHIMNIALIVSHGTTNPTQYGANLEVDIPALPFLFRHRFGHTCLSSSTAHAANLYAHGPEQSRQKLRLITTHPLPVPFPRPILQSASDMECGGPPPLRIQPGVSSEPSPVHIYSSEPFFTGAFRAN